MDSRESSQWFTIFHYALAAKKYEATVGYNEPLRGQVGAVLL